LVNAFLISILRNPSKDQALPQGNSFWPPGKDRQFAAVGTYNPGSPATILQKYRLKQGKIVIVGKLYTVAMSRTLIEIGG
jgi:hypothetical protein